jgi:alpha-beta hydrolase superfamily lysophospholipase
MLGAEMPKHLLGEEPALVPRTAEALIPIVVLFILSLLAFHAHRPGPRKWISAKTVWPQTLPAPLQLERAIVVNCNGLQLRRFTIRAPNPVGACVLVHGFGVSAHFEFLAPTHPGGPHAAWDNSILQQLVEAGISCYAIDLQSHGESEGTRGLRAYFEQFDDLVFDALQLHDAVVRETGGALPIFWLGTSMGGAVAARASQLRPNCMAGLAMLAPMISLEKVAEKKLIGPIRNRHLSGVAPLLSWLLPTLPLINKSESEHAQQLDVEFQADATNYTGAVRVRVAYLFDTLCRLFIRRNVPQSLENVACDALLVIHANADTMTEPSGSCALFERASCKRKTLVLIGGEGIPGRFRSVAEDGVIHEGLGAASKKASKSISALRELDELDMWHSITTEPGSEKVSAAVAQWMADEAISMMGKTTASRTASGGRRASQSPHRRR